MSNASAQGVDVYHEFDVWCHINAVSQPVPVWIEIGTAVNIIIAIVALIWYVV